MPIVPIPTPITPLLIVSVQDSASYSATTIDRAQRSDRISNQRLTLAFIIGVRVPYIRGYSMGTGNAREGIVQVT